MKKCAVVMMVLIGMSYQVYGDYLNLKCFTPGIEVQTGNRVIYGLTLAPDGSKLYAAYWTDTSSDPLAVYSSAGCPLPLLDTMSYGRCHGGVAVSSDGRYLFTPSYYEGDVSRFDLLNGNSRISLGAGSWPVGIGISPDGTKLVVLSGCDGRSYDMNNDAVYVYDISSGNFSFLIAVSLNDEPRGLRPVFSKDSQYAYVVTYKRKSPSARLYEVSLNEGNVSRYLEFPTPSNCLASITRNDQYLFISDTDNSKVWVVDIEAWAAVDSISLPFAPSAISMHPDGRHLFVTSSDYVYVYDMNTKSFVTSLNLGQPADIVFTQDGKTAFVSHAHYTDGGITTLDISNLKLVKPNGGESWVAGTTQTVQWEIIPGANIVDVNIQYSTNNGLDWNDVNTVPNTGSYNWTVPQVTSNQCLVRISNAADANVFDVSNNTFIIYQCQLNSKADLNNDCKVNTTDLALFANDWLRNGNPFDENYTEPLPIMWVYINDPGVSEHEGFTGYMSKYETTNAQYCQFLNAALASGDITVDGNDVLGASGSNSGEDYAGELYYDGDGWGLPWDGATNGGAARINYSGGVFWVDSGFENHPVTFVSWYGAAAFCNYYGYRLPTEWEWQAVADYNDNRPYPCGTTIPNIMMGNFLNSTHPDGTTIVGAFGTYGYGMCDMGGNVFEWTSPNYILRGGGWCDAPLTVSYQDNRPPDYSDRNRGFRACR